MNDEVLTRDGILEYISQELIYIEQIVASGEQVQPGADILATIDPFTKETLDRAASLIIPQGDLSNRAFERALISIATETNAIAIIASTGLWLRGGTGRVRLPDPTEVVMVVLHHKSFEGHWIARVDRPEGLGRPARIYPLTQSFQAEQPWASWSGEFEFKDDDNLFRGLKPNTIRADKTSVN